MELCGENHDSNNIVSVFVREVSFYAFAFI